MNPLTLVLFIGMACWLEVAAGPVGVAALAVAAEVVAALVGREVHRGCACAVGSGPDAHDAALHRGDTRR